MQCTTTLRAPLAQRASTIANRRPARRVALRAVAFRTDNETEASTTSAVESTAVKIAEATRPLKAKASEAAAWAQTKWEQSDNKPAIVATGLTAFVALYVANGVISSIDRVPLLASTFELLGLGVSAWFAYRWFFVAGEREAISADVKALAKDIGLDL